MRVDICKKNKYVRMCDTNKFLSSEWNHDKVSLALLQEKANVTTKKL